MEFTRVKYVPAGGGQMIDNGPVQIRIVEHGDNTTHRVGITEVRLKPDTLGPPQHYHLNHEETFYVVSGLVRFSSAGESIEVGPGGLITAPLRAPHTFANPDHDEPAIMLVTYTPDRYIKYFQQMGGLALGGGQITDDQDIDIMSGYETYPYPPHA
jgi:mannose-6-phosphate isomerase-like protein (cupin superfamily)